MDRQSLEAFEADLKNNLYKIWNRMSSGTYFPSEMTGYEEASVILEQARAAFSTLAAMVGV